MIAFEVIWFSGWRPDTVPGDARQIGLVGDNASAYALCEILRIDVVACRDLDAAIAKAANQLKHDRAPSRGAHGFFVRRKADQT